MSGIAGYYGKAGASEKVEYMIQSIKHRGLNNPIIRRGSSGAIAFVGANLNGIGGEEEPFVMIDGTLVRNDSRQEVSDAEYLRQQYSQHSKGVFSKISGSFSCAIMDEDECIIARDHVGVRPVIYHESSKEELMFASEAKALKELTNNVEELPPGHYYSSKEGLSKFDKCPVMIPKWDNTEEAIEAVRKVIIDAVKESLLSGGIGGVALSGGLDSSIVLTVAQQYNKNMKAFTATLAGHYGEDLQYAKLLADFLDVEHHVIEITQDDIEKIIPEAVWYLESFDEDCILGFIANYYTARLAAKHVKSVLVGEGADELFGGYFAELKDIPDPDEKQRIDRKLLEIAYKTSLRRLDRSWMSNSVEYSAPFLHPAAAEICSRLSMELKCYTVGEGKTVEKWILREAFRDMLPQEIADRPKMRFSRGVGIDDQVYKAVQKSICEKRLEEMSDNTKVISLGTKAELFYHRIFQRYFPKGYDRLSCRWDPFK